MARFLVTGGSGFFGSLLLNKLLADGHDCMSIDLLPNSIKHTNLKSIEGDIRDFALIESVFRDNEFEAVFHCAAILAHGNTNDNFLWTTNVDGSKNIANACKEYGVKKLIFLSSNCLWGEPKDKPVTENDEPAPIEIYGRSKLEAENILLKYAPNIEVVILRCPTIIDEGRLGLLALLFEFIADGKKVWIIGNGRNRYQFIYAKDLIRACQLCVQSPIIGIFNIGSDNVPTFAEMYSELIKHAKTKARIAFLPKKPAVTALRILSFFRLSPLGPYHYKMIAESFVFSTEKIKKALSWEPTLKNDEMLKLAYDYYRSNNHEKTDNAELSPHRKKSPMGIIRIIKWIS